MLLLVTARQRGCGRIMFSVVSVLLHVTARQRSCRRVMFSVVSVISQSFCPHSVPMMHWTSTYREPPPAPPPHIGRYCTRTSLYPLLVTSGNQDWSLFKLVHLRATPTLVPTYLLANETRMVGKWAVRILECFPVTFSIQRNHTISHLVQLDIFRDVLCELNTIAGLSTYRHQQPITQCEHLVMI